MAQESFEAWWNGLGIVTRLFLAAAVISTVGFSSGMIPAELIVVELSDTLWKLQLWRPISACVFLGKVGFPWLINLAMFVVYLDRNDKDFVGRTADLVWMIFIIIGVLHLVGALLVGLRLLSFAFSMALVWVWCRRHEDARLSLYMFSFSGTMFPWVMVAFHALLGQSIVDDIIGIIAGHAYYFAADMLPKTHGINLIHTPAFLYRWIPRQNLGAYTVFGSSTRPTPAAADAGAHRWGGGRALGG